jgi:hypothetical protein
MMDYWRNARSDAGDASRSHYQKAYTVYTPWREGVYTVYAFRQEGAKPQAAAQHRRRRHGL